jgi:hypothetical protein
MGLVKKDRSAPDDLQFSLVQKSSRIDTRTSAAGSSSSRWRPRAAFLVQGEQGPGFIIHHEAPVHRKKWCRTPLCQPKCPDVRLLT